MGSERELLQTGDSAVSKPANILTNQLLNNENVPLLYQNSNRDAQRTVDEQFPRVQLYSNTDNYNQYGVTPRDNKVDNSVPKPENTTPNTLKTDIWGGDEKATQNRKKPMEVAIQEDGSATVQVKPGDTVWDIAKRTLEQQNRKNGKPEPTNKEIYNKMKEIEKLNGGNCAIIRPGQQIKIAKEDVSATQSADKKDAEKNEKNEKDDKSEKNDESKKQPADRSAFLAEQQKWLITPDAEGKSPFARMDKNENGAIDQNEIDEYVRAHKADGSGTAQQPDPHRLTAEQELYLRELQEKNDSIEDLHDDDGWDDWIGVSVGDLDKWTKAEQTKEQAKQDKAQAEQMLKDDETFNKLSGGDGVITAKDVDAYIETLKKSGAVKEADLRALALIKEQCSIRPKGELTKENRTWQEPMQSGPDYYGP